MEISSRNLKMADDITELFYNVMPFVGLKVKEFAF